MNALFKKGVLVAALAMTASSVMAADSIDLKVTGKIIPPACTPAFASGGGTVDFGDILTSSLQIAKDSKLPEIKEVPVTITCEQPSRFGVTFTDQRADSRSTTEMDSLFASTDFAPTPDYYFGLGFTSEQKQIGVYALGVNELGAPNADGETRYSIFSTDGGTTWTSGHDISAGTGYSPIKNNGTDILAFAKDNESTVSPETSLTFRIGVSAVIQDLNTLHVTDEITLDGLTAINLVYL
ncbi:DUF1120 domain-containing protein [Salmonella enterica]|nr:DUF1120 domain-containing protein [Salmonella enterica]